MEDVQAELELRQEEVQQLSLQLELHTREHQAQEEQLQDAFTELQVCVWVCVCAHVPGGLATGGPL